MYFLLKMGIFYCYVSLPEGLCSVKAQDIKQLSETTELVDFIDFQFDEFMFGLSWTLTTYVDVAQTKLQTAYFI